MDTAFLFKTLADKAFVAKIQLLIQSKIFVKVRGMGGFWWGGSCPPTPLNNDICHVVADGDPCQSAILLKSTKLQPDSASHHGTSHEMRSETSRHLLVPTR